MAIDVQTEDLIEEVRRSAIKFRPLTDEQILKIIEEKLKRIAAIISKNGDVITKILEPAGIMQFLQGLIEILTVIENMYLHSDKSAAHFFAHNLAEVFEVRNKVSDVTIQGDEKQRVVFRYGMAGDCLRKCQEINPTKVKPVVVRFQLDLMRMSQSETKEDDRDKRIDMLVEKFEEFQRNINSIV